MCHCVTHTQMPTAFSSAYLAGRTFVEPADRPVSAVDPVTFADTTATVYGTDADGLPLVVRVGRRHLPVIGADDVPTGTMCVPTALLADATATERTVLIARDTAARRLLRWGYVTGAALSSRRRRRPA